MATYKGFYKPKNPQKYKGDVSSIIYRSSWERSCMNYFDNNPSIIEWQSEELFIRYRSPIDGKVHRYFPDFKIKVKDSNGKIITYLIEVKPYYQTQPPTVKSRKTKRYINEVKTYGINTSKWHAAELYCADRGWRFQIITEHELGIK
jgi:hypothetical protein